MTPDPVVIHVVTGLITASVSGRRTSFPTLSPPFTRIVMMRSEDPEESTSTGISICNFDCAEMVIGSIAPTKTLVLLVRTRNLISRSLEKSLMTVTGTRSLFEVRV